MLRSRRDQIRTLRYEVRCAGRVACSQHLDRPESFIKNLGDIFDRQDISNFHLKLIFEKPFRKP